MEYALWARRPIDEEWNRTILTVTHCRERLAEVQDLATAEGWIEFTIQRLDGTAPDFAATVRR